MPKLKDTSRCCLTLTFIFVIAFPLTVQSANSKRLDPLQILKEAAEIAHTIKSSPNATIVDRDQFYALKDIALAQARYGDKRSSAKTFKDIKDRILGASDISPQLRKLREDHYARNRDTYLDDGLSEFNRHDLTLNKVLILEQIADAEVQAGHTRQGYQTLRRVAELAEELPDNDTSSGRRWKLEDIVTAQLKIKDWRGASETVKRLSQHVASLRGADEEVIRTAISDKHFHRLSIDPFLEIDDPSKIAAGVERAREEVERIGNERERALLLRDIAVAQARLGCCEEAIATIGEMLATRSTFERQDAGEMVHYNSMDILKVAKAFVASGENECATKAIQQTIDTVRKEEVARNGGSAIWQEISITKALVGDIDGALGAQTEIHDQAYVEATWPFIARAFIKAGDLKAARNIALRMNLQEIMVEIVIAQAEQGDIKGAVETSGAVDKSYLDSKVQITRAVAFARTKTGEAWGTYEWAKNLSTPVETTYALLGIAEGLQWPPTGLNSGGIGAKQTK